MKLDDFATRADQLIAQADAALATKFLKNYVVYVEAGAHARFRSGSLSFLRNVFGTDHPYYAEFAARTTSTTQVGINAGREILGSAKDEILGGWFERVRSLVSAEIFADFIDMATYLLDEHYKDAAAVMMGSVLEEHLRQLCRKARLDTEYLRDGVPVPKKADALNSDLTKAEVYSRLDQKAVTAWLDLRNKAAHGRYTEYTEEQVRLMVQGITEFMARVAP